MAELYGAPKLDVKITLVLSAQEAQALYALTEYGDMPFLECFYKCLGKDALQPHEQGLRDVFASFRMHLPVILSRVEKARAALRGDEFPQAVKA